MGLLNSVFHTCSKTTNKMLTLNNPKSECKIIHNISHTHSSAHKIASGWSTKCGWDEREIMLYGEKTDVRD